MRATHVEAPSHDWADEDPRDATPTEPPEPSAERRRRGARRLRGAAREEAEDEEIAGVAHADPDAPEPAPS